ncbi:hypothetical protein [Streptomyces sp. NPDC002187]|uniref:hypothetical protein n=1 Tax=Streptomyces sp. NPDC002187 TaxID=3364637 RepID=UPI003691DB3B
MTRCSARWQATLQSAERTGDEAEFGALRHFALNGTDNSSHDEQNAAIGAHVRRRNTRAEPKTNFAPDTPIRTWTEYPARAG